MSHSESFLNETLEILARLDRDVLEQLTGELVALRERGGRLFALGVGGGAAHASHAVNDFRKLAGIEAYAPTDNVAELTARTNDDGWPAVFRDWLETSRLGSNDMVFVFSVGGGDEERGISANLVEAIRFARASGATVCGVVGRDGGFTARHADVCLIVPPLNDATVTPQTEAVQAVVWHLLVSHPALQQRPGKWESVV